MISGDCMFLHMFEDEQKDAESKNALSGASEPHSGLQFLTGSLLQLWHQGHWHALLWSKECSPLC